MENLQLPSFPVQPSQEFVDLYIYADEIKNKGNTIPGESWTYIALLVIEANEKQKVIDEIFGARKDVGYYGEIHFSNLSNYSYASVHAEKTRLAKRWTELLLSEGKPRIIRFYILGLNLSNLQLVAFGESAARERNIYNRFFRSACIYCLKAFYGDCKSINVKGVFHDKGNLEKDELFDWHTVWRIKQQEENISFDMDRILFVDSNHDKEKLYPEESHLIQMTDLVLGATSQCLDASPNRDGCDEIGCLFLPLVKRLNDSRRASNPRSRYNYFKKCSLSFFPSKKLTMAQLDDKWERLTSSFYKDRPLLLKDKISGQKQFWSI